MHRVGLILVLLLMAGAALATGVGDDLPPVPDLLAPMDTRSGDANARPLPSLHSAGALRNASIAASRADQDVYLDEDPWVDGPPPPPAPPRAAPARAHEAEAHTWSRVVPRADGSWRSESWRESPLLRTAGQRLVTYELRGMEPDESEDFDGLRGAGYRGPWPAEPWWQRAEAPVRSPAEAQPANWWHALAEALMRSVGHGSWPLDATLLAFDSSRGLLHVQHTPAVLERIEAELDLWDRRAQELSVLRVDIHAGELRKASFELHLPGWQHVRAQRGSAVDLIGDYDIEVSQGSYLAEPYFERLECGHGVCAARGRGRHVGAVHVTVAFSPGDPKPEPFVLEPNRTLALPTVHLEHCPTNVLHEWRGLVRLDAASAVEFDVSPGLRGRAWAQRVAGAGTPPVRTWVRVGAVPKDARPVARSFLLRGSRSGHISEARVLFPGRGAARWLRASPPPAADDTEAKRGAELVGESVVRGGIRIEADVVGALAAPSALDVLLELGLPRSDMRRVPLSHLAKSPHGLRPHAKLQTADLRSFSRRMHLDRHGAGQLTFRADVGAGMEWLHLHVRPAAAKD